jgi:hypothetical protein
MAAALHGRGRAGHEWPLDIQIRRGRDAATLKAIVIEKANGGTKAALADFYRAGPSLPTAAFPHA